jgi:ankyrin repeat protein
MIHTNVNKSLAKAIFLLAFYVIFLPSCSSSTTIVPDPVVQQATLQANLLLHDVAKCGDVKKVKQLLDEGKPTNVVDELGYTPLHWAAQNGHEPVVKLLVENGADLESKNKDGHTPFNLAVRHGHHKISEFLLKYPLHRKDNDGYTPLHLAVKEKGNTAMVQWLIDQGAYINVRAGVKKMDGNKIDNTEKTALYCSIEEGNEEIAKLLITLKADVNKKTKYIHRTPLHAAVENSHATLAEFLVKSNARLDERDNRGYTPLYVAAKKGYKEIATLLLNAKANVNIPDRQGNKILAVAVDEGNRDIIQLLLQADPEKSDVESVYTKASNQEMKDFIELHRKK